MTTVRLPVEYEQKLDSYELGEPYFGQYGSGDGSLSVTYKTKIKEKIENVFQMT